jgi:Glyoxalase-like domain
VSEQSELQRLGTPRFQVAVDAADPHRLNRFWAAAVGYDVEDHHDQITELIAAGIAAADDAVEIDGRKAWRIAAASRDPAGTGPRLLFQQVPEAKSGKNRVHLDLQRDLDDPQREAEVERLVGLGATHLWDGRQGPHTWATLADPEGNEFCVS